VPEMQHVPAGGLIEADKVKKDLADLSETR
jgi:hypothetical protein